MDTPHFAIYSTKGCQWHSWLTDIECFLPRKAIGECVGKLIQEGRKRKMGQEGWDSEMFLDVTLQVLGTHFHVHPRKYKCSFCMILFEEIL